MLCIDIQCTTPFLCCTILSQNRKKGIHAVITIQSQTLSKFSWSFSPAIRQLKVYLCHAAQEISKREMTNWWWLNLSSPGRVFPWIVSQAWDWKVTCATQFFLKLDRLRGIKSFEPAKFLAESKLNMVHFF